MNLDSRKRNPARTRARKSALLIRFFIVFPGRPLLPAAPTILPLPIPCGLAGWLRRRPCYLRLRRRRVLSFRGGWLRRRRVLLLPPHLLLLLLLLPLLLALQILLLLQLLLLLLPLLLLLLLLLQL